MAAKPSTKTKAWVIFDRIIEEVAPGREYSNPWERSSEDGKSLVYRPDFATLTRLLGVPLALRADTTTGVPALALDVWTAYEFRRAGFAPDAVWPRDQHPRVLPTAISNLLNASWDRKAKDALSEKLAADTPLKGVAASSANILGKNYLKQVDVVMSDWLTGPELLVSTKRMDSSFGKNAANRVEESYGDAKNLRLRHPLASLGFMYGLRSTILAEEPDKARWLIDLLGKLGREDDAYHAVTLLMIEYYGADAVPDDTEAIDPSEDALVGAGLDDQGTEPGELSENVDTEPVGDDEVTATLAALPLVVIRHEDVPDELQPARFFQVMIERILAATPINMHVEARVRRSTVSEGASDDA